MRPGKRTLLPLLTAFIALLSVAPAYLTCLDAEARARGGQPELTVVFTGDIMITRRVGDDIEEHSDPYYPFKGMGEYLKDADLTVGNLETSVSERGAPYDKKCTFRADPKSLQGIKDAGIDIMTLANNHICDFGPDATNDTQVYLDEYGIKYYGLWHTGEKAGNASPPRPVFMDVKGIRFAFLGYGEYLYEGFDMPKSALRPVPLDMAVMKADLEYTRPLADVVVVSIHWCRVPQFVKDKDPGQTELCHQLCDWGADILANHGPHVLQETESYNGSLIFYSLGNTVFDQHEPSSHYSMLPIIKMEGARPVSMRLIPLVQNDEDNQFIPRGKVAEVTIGPGMYLDWAFYNSTLFCSDEPITDYTGPKHSISDLLMRPEAILVMAVAVAGLLLIVILIIWLRRRK